MSTRKRVFESDSNANLTRGPHENAFSNRIRKFRVWFEARFGGESHAKMHFRIQVTVWRFKILNSRNSKTRSWLTVDKINIVPGPACLTVRTGNAPPTSLASSTHCAARHSAPSLSSLAFSARRAARRSALSLHFASLSSQMRSCPRSLPPLAAPLDPPFPRPALRHAQQGQRANRRLSKSDR